MHMRARRLYLYTYRHASLPRLSTSQPPPLRQMHPKNFARGRGDGVHSECDSECLRKPDGDARRGEARRVVVAPPYLIRSSPPTSQASHDACFAGADYANCILQKLVLSGGAA